MNQLPTMDLQSNGVLNNIANILTQDQHLSPDDKPSINPAEGIKQTYQQLIQPLKGSVPTVSHDPAEQQPQQVPQQAAPPQTSIQAISGFIPQNIQHSQLATINQPQVTLQTQHIYSSQPPNVVNYQPAVDTSSQGEFQSLLDDLDDLEPVNPTTAPAQQQGVAQLPYQNQPAPNQASQPPAQGGFLDLLDDDDDDIPSDVPQNASSVAQVAQYPASQAQVQPADQAAYVAVPENVAQVQTHRAPDGSEVYIIPPGLVQAGQQQMSQIVPNGSLQQYEYQQQQGQQQGGPVYENGNVELGGPVPYDFTPPDGYDVAGWSMEQGVPTVTLVPKRPPPQSSVPSVHEPPAKRPRGRSALEPWQKRWEARQPRDKENTWCSMICGVCEQGQGDLITCMGPCMRAFHPVCIGVEKPPPHELPRWYCPECETGQWYCLVCGGRSTGANDANFVKCILPICGRFYHKSCIQNHPFTVKSAKADSFRCPQHYCNNCTRGGEGRDMCKCTRCPYACHAACMLPGAAKLAGRSKVILCKNHAHQLPKDFVHPTKGLIKSPYIQQLRERPPPAIAAPTAARNNYPAQPPTLHLTLQRTPSGSAHLVPSQQLPHEATGNQTTTIMFSQPMAPQQQHQQQQLSQQQQQQLQYQIQGLQQQQQQQQPQQQQYAPVGASKGGGDVDDEAILAAQRDFMEKQQLKIAQGGVGVGS